MKKPKKPVYRYQGNPDDAPGCLELKQRTPSEWLRLLRTDIQDPIVRVKVAQIVWWDYFSHRHCTNAWHHLDGLVAAYRPLGLDLCTPPKGMIAEALKAVGYPPRIAVRRAEPPKATHIPMTVQVPDDGEALP